MAGSRTSRERLRAVVAQQEQPGVDRAGHRGGQRAGSRDEVEPQRSEVLDRGAGRRGTLASKHPRRGSLRRRDDRRHLPAGSVQVRLHHVQDEARRSTAASKALPPRSSARIAAWEASQCVDDDHPEGALQRRPGGEGHSGSRQPPCAIGLPGDCFSGVVSWAAGLVCRGPSRRGAPGDRRPSRRRCPAARAPRRRIGRTRAGIWCGSGIPTAGRAPTGCRRRAEPACGRAAGAGPRSGPPPAAPGCRGAPGGRRSSPGSPFRPAGPGTSRRRRRRGTPPRTGRA